MPIATIATEEGPRLAVTKVLDGTRYVSCSCCTDAAFTCCVYPGACDKGPASVLFYGTVLEGDGNTYGDTTNGVIRESGVWAVYRNGVRTTRDCLSMSYSGGSFTSALLPTLLQGNVAANLATSYELELSYEPSGLINTTVLFRGGVSSSFGDEFGGQCVWSGGSGTQAYDEGFSLIFAKLSCRWILATGPLGYLIGYRESGSPVGSYTIFNPENEEYAVIS